VPHSQPIHPSCFHHPNRIWWGCVRVKKLLILQLSLFSCYLLKIFSISVLKHCFSYFMQQKVIVTSILHSRHVSPLHGYHQVSVAMLNCCTVLYWMSQLHVISYRYSLIKITNYFKNKSTLLNLIKPVNSNLLMGPIGGVGVSVFRVVHGCWCEC
jgi:hypothetical protein